MIKDMARIRSLLIAIFLLVSVFPVKGEEGGSGFVFTDPYSLFPGGDADFSYGSFMRADAWRGETVILKAYAKAERDGEVRVSSSALESGDTVLADAVSVCFLECVSASRGVGENSPAPHVSVPDMVSKKNERYFEAGEDIFLQIRIDIPEDAPEGIYEAGITVNGESALTLEVRVMPYVLGEDVLSFELWQYPYGSLRYYEILHGEQPFSDRHLSVLEKEMELYHSLGGENITVTVTDEPWGHQTYDDTPSMVKWHIAEDGTLSFDYREMDAWIIFCRERGIDERIDVFGILPFSGSWTAQKEDGSLTEMSYVPGSKEWEEVWTVFLEDFIRHMEELGGREEIFIAVDERAPEDMTAVCELTERVSRGRLKTSAAVADLEGDLGGFDRLAVSVAAFQKKEEEMRALIEARREAGKVTLLYNCSTNYPNVFALSEPAESIWTAEYLYGMGFDGYLRWAYDAWTEDPYRNLDWMYFEAGDTMLVYPDRKDAEDPDIFSSYRLEMIRQGFTRVTKLDTLAMMLEESDRESLERVVSGLYRGYGNWNEWGAMSAKNENTVRLIRIETEKADEAIRLAEAILSKDAKASGRLKKLADRRSLLEYLHTDISWDGAYLKYNKCVGMTDLACLGADVIMLVFLLLKKKKKASAAAGIVCLAAAVTELMTCRGPLVLISRHTVRSVCGVLIVFAVMIISFGKKYHSAELPGE